MEKDPLHRRNLLLHLQTRPGYDQPVLLKQAAHQVQSDAGDRSPGARPACSNDRSSAATSVNANLSSGRLWKDHPGQPFNSGQRLVSFLDSLLGAISLRR
jgi:hypothetical protein